MDSRNSSRPRLHVVLSNGTGVPRRPYWAPVHWLLVWTMGCNGQYSDPVVSDYSYSRSKASGVSNGSPIDVSGAPRLPRPPTSDCDSYTVEEYKVAITRYYIDARVLCLLNIDDFSLAETYAQYAEDFDEACPPHRWEHRFDPCDAMACADAAREVPGMVLANPSLCEDLHYLPYDDEIALCDVIHEIRREECSAEDD